MKSRSQIQGAARLQDSDFESYIRNEYVKNALRKFALNDYQAKPRKLTTPASHDLIHEIDKLNPLVGSDLHQYTAQEGFRKQISQKWKEINSDKEPQPKLSPNRIMDNPTINLRDMIFCTEKKSKSLVFSLNKVRSVVFSSVTDTDKPRETRLAKQTSFFESLPALPQSKSTINLSVPSLERINSQRNLSGSNRMRTELQSPCKLPNESVQTYRDIPTESPSHVRGASLGSTRGNLSPLQRKTFKGEQINQILSFRRRMKQISPMRSNPEHKKVIGRFLAQINCPQDSLQA